MIPMAVSMALGSACAPLARVEVHQPRAGGRQQDLRLGSDWAVFAEDGGTRVLLSFPLPGARRGNKHYQLYWRCPSHSGVFELRSGGADNVRGLFRQLRGRHAGMEPFERAMIQISGSAETCSGWFEIQCRDGTRLKGDFVARRSDWEVVEFEETLGLE